MCGIIGVFRRLDDRPDLDPAAILDWIITVEASIAEASNGATTAASLWAAADHLAALDLELRSMPGVRALVADAALATEIEARVTQIGNAGVALETRLDTGEATADDAEAVNAALIRLKDAVWTITRDRVRTARAISNYVGSTPQRSMVEGFWCIQVALSAIDRLEVRGRDSAGIEVIVRNHGLSLGDAGAVAGLQERLHDTSFRSRAVRVDGDQIVFVYKAAAEIGELGDNTADIGGQLANDDLLRAALAGPDAEVMVLGHTRWASVGIISEANAHPLDSFELEQRGGEVCPLVTSVLNGDVDNFADLKALHGLRIAPEITTDAKVIPTLVSRGIGGGETPVEAFRAAVSAFEGSVAIGTVTSAAPDTMFLALRGSGQALYVGLADHCFIVASEPYGVVEEATSYLRMDGETPANPDNPIGSQGQLIALSATGAGLVDGISRHGYDGTELPVSDTELVVPEITTRDIDLGDAPHFFLKEVGEAPQSFRKTLRGKIIDGPSGLEEQLGEVAFPAAVRERIRTGKITKVLAIGQGTAAVAGQSLETFLLPLTRGKLRVEATLATELSGFGLRDDMSDTLVVADEPNGRSCPRPRRDRVGHRQPAGQ